MPFWDVAVCDGFAFNSGGAIPLLDGWGRVSTACPCYVVPVHLQDIGLQWLRYQQTEVVLYKFLSTVAQP